MGIVMRELFRVVVGIIRNTFFSYPFGQFLSIPVPWCICPIHTQSDGPIIHQYLELFPGHLACWIPGLDNTMDMSVLLQPEVHFHNSCYAPSGCFSALWIRLLVATICSTSSSSSSSCSNAQQTKQTVMLKSIGDVWRSYSAGRRCFYRSNHIAASNQSYTMLYYASRI